jgi:hypothetical protein
MVPHVDLPLVSFLSRDLKAENPIFKNLICRLSRYTCRARSLDQTEWVKEIAVIERERDIEKLRSLWMFPLAQKKQAATDESRH